MPALGLSLGLPFGRISAAGGDLTPQNIQATSEELNIHFTWDADANLGYLLYFNLVNDFGTANYFATPAAGSTSFDASTPTNTSFGSIPIAGSKYYYWLVGSDGGAGPVTGPSNVASGRGFVTLTNGASATLYVPNGAVMDLNDLIFRSGGNIPVACNILYGADVYSSAGDGTWEDAINGGFVNPPISGSFIFENFTGSSLTFWDTEP